MSCFKGTLVVISVLITVLSILLRINTLTKLGKVLTHDDYTEIKLKALPVWSNPDLTLANKIVEYMLPLVPWITSCPSDPEKESECVQKQRNFVSSFGIWEASTVVESMKASVVRIPRSNGDLEVILLTPKGLLTEKQHAPLIIWAHGGGYVLGNARDDYLASILELLHSSNHSSSSAMKNAIWASVEYRLAPEHPYPAASDDVFLALEHLTSKEGLGLGKGGVHLAGASAGVGVLLTAALEALWKGYEIQSLSLDIPAIPTQKGLALWKRTYEAETTHRRNASIASNSEKFVSFFESESYHRNAFSRVLPLEFLDWGMHAYSGNDTSVDFMGGALDVNEWRRISKTAKQNKSGHAVTLPKVLILTSRADPLCDAGVEFGRMYREAGGDVKSFDGLSSHGIMQIFDTEHYLEFMFAWMQVVAGETWCDANQQCDANN